VDALPGFLGQWGPASNSGFPGEWVLTLIRMAADVCGDGDGSQPVSGTRCDTVGWLRAGFLRRRTGGLLGTGWIIITRYERRHRNSTCLPIFADRLCKAGIGRMLLGGVHGWGSRNGRSCRGGRRLGKTGPARRMQQRVGTSPMPGAVGCSVLPAMLR